MDWQESRDAIRRNGWAWALNELSIRPVGSSWLWGVADEMAARFTTCAVGERLRSAGIDPVSFCRDEEARALSMGARLGWDKAGPWYAAGMAFYDAMRHRNLAKALEVYEEIQRLELPEVAA